ncbi:hypothetical protein HPB52_003469 [Rhipicephalus sanguineus]|uniref:CCHC-type domain-containing protein n=1 Tax=Rhipicephalus sanguineus TaxID=34632 RepID=A0A9D4Q9F4_RHISA|nr:hypothetical protein HPB52_003469 [Rhipicephalus sanguineus]
MPRSLLPTPLLQLTTLAEDTVTSEGPEEEMDDGNTSAPSSAAFLRTTPPPPPPTITTNPRKKKKKKKGKRKTVLVQGPAAAPSSSKGARQRLAHAPNSSEPPPPPAPPLVPVTSSPSSWKPEDQEGFQPALSKAARRRARDIAAATLPVDPAVVGTMLYRPSTTGGSFKGSPRLTLAQALSSRAGVSAIRINHKRNIVAADATTKECLEQLFAVKELQGIPVSAKEPSDRRTNTGFLHGIDGEPTDASLLPGIVSSVLVMSATREGSTVTLRFSGPVPPEHVSLFRVQFRVRPARPRPLQCRQCGRFGHVKETCDWPHSCIHCGQAHRGDEGCQRRRCVNCGGPHSAHTGLPPLAAGKTGGHHYGFPPQRLCPGRGFVLRSEKNYSRTRCPGQLGAPTLACCSAPARPPPSNKGPPLHGPPGHPGLQSGPPRAQLLRRWPRLLELLPPLHLPGLLLPFPHRLGLLLPLPNLLPLPGPLLK